MRSELSVIYAPDGLAVPHAACRVHLDFGDGILRQAPLYLTATAQIAQDKVFTDGTGLLHVFLDEDDCVDVTVQHIAADGRVLSQQRVWPNPPMRVQPLVPYITDDNRILGLEVVPDTTFTGFETNLAVDGVLRPTRCVRVRGNYHRDPYAFLAFRVSPTEERTAWAPSNLQLGGQTSKMLWVMTAGSNQLQASHGTLMDWLMRSPFVVPVTLGPTTPTGTLDWTATASFRTRGSVSFTDIDTSVLLVGSTRYAVEDIVSVSAASAPSVSPTSPSSLRAGVISTTPVTLSASATGTTLRVFSVTSTIAPGNYTWDLTFTLKDNSVRLASITVIVPA